MVFRIVAGMTPIDPEDPTTDEAVSGIAFYGALALWIWWACRRSGTGIRQLVGRVPEGPFDLAAELQEIDAMALPGLGIAAVTFPVLVWYLRHHWPGRGGGDSV